MSLQFVFGPSGSGKSTQVYNETIRRAAEEPGKNFLIIVPDQFTMQTQKDLVTLSQTGGIMNIDVLSFGRLNHRIMEEVGREEIPVLDDTGKSLVLQKVAADLKEEMPLLGSFLQKQGYIHEVKSAISEFMQYGIAPTDVSKLIDYAKKRGALVQKLRDLRVIYQGFMEYIQGNFITTEETLDVLCRSLHKSKLLQNSVVVFDGFTGFTPIQYRVLSELMRLCEKVIVVLTLGAGDDPNNNDGEQKLFHLSKKTAADLSKIAAELKVPRDGDVFVLSENGRFKSAPALAHLEANLFRFGAKAYEKEQSDITLFEALNPKSEVRQTGLQIKELIAEQGMSYRDIAVVVGNMEAYAPFVETEFERMEIPCFIDRTRGIVLNPMVEFIKSALELFLHDFSYEAVFRYLRSGMADMTPEEVDLFENYIMAAGIRGYSKYQKLFTRKIEDAEDAEEKLAQINELRERFLSQVSMLRLKKGEPAKEYVNQLYEFLVQNRVQEKLAVFEAAFKTEGQLTREREYAQIYRLVMELLEQIYELLGEESITLREFADILEAGFGEIEVGTIPQNVDRVLVGDLERTRLKQIKVLFVLGVNDGNIPKNASKGGIISDVDREFLRESDVELAPSPRQQMFIQRLYLYLNLTKPSEQLYLSYSKIDSSGKSMRPAYLIDTVKKLFPTLTVQFPEMRSAIDQIVTAREGAAYLAEGLRDYAAGVVGEEREKEILTIYHAFSQDALAETKDFLTEAAFKRYKEGALSKAVAQALYGKYLQNSVTRLESFAECAYSHFLEYGLTLQERKEFSFERNDLGNVYHEVLERFAKGLSDHGHTWFDFTPEYAETQVRKAVLECAASYGGTILYSSARNEYALVRMTRIMTRTVMTLQEQLKKGEFLPASYEMSFHFTDSMDSVNVTLSEEEKMRLRGRIDRVDMLEDDEAVYVKVVDYKSGSHQFDLAALYYGLQLQLVVYMNAAMETLSKKYPDKEIVPAAMLYYHIDDPTVDEETEKSDAEIQAAIAKKLCMTGVVNSERGIAQKLDKNVATGSDVIPVSINKNGSFSSTSSVLAEEDLKVLSQFVTRKMVEIGKSILNGNIALNPYGKGKKTACDYCAYKNVCGFETSMPGCEMRSLPTMKKDEAMEKIKEAIEERRED